MEGTVFLADAAGNMVEGPSPLDPTVMQKYVYDAWNRLVEVTDGADDPIITNEYDGLGRRIVKDVADGATFDYYYNESWQLVNELKDGSAENIFHWHPYYIDALAASFHGTGQTAYYFLHDANFNVTAVVHDDGGDKLVVERYAYTTYGEVTVLDADFAVDGDGASDIGNTHLYTGRERDPETGLQLNRERFYAAHFGRWVNRDPIGYEGGWNLYGYVNENPASGVDPTGLACLVYYVCINTGQERLDWKTVRCNYACTIDTTKGGKGGDPPGMRTVLVGGASCTDPGIQAVVASYRTYENHFDLVGECDCDQTIKTQRAWDHWKNIFRDCRRKKCKADAKEQLKVLSGICKALPAGPAKKICQAAMKAQQEVFDTLCNQCKDP